jgi:hypothetical protein
MLQAADVVHGIVIIATVHTYMYGLIAQHGVYVSQVMTIAFMANPTKSNDVLRCNVSCYHLTHLKVACKAHARNVVAKWLQQLQRCSNGRCC